jgi:hypothetical protein
MKHIRQINSVNTKSYTIVDLSDYKGIIEQHPTIVLHPDLFEVSDDDLPEFYQLVKPSFEVPQDVALWQIMATLNILGLEQTVLGALALLTEPTKSVVDRFMKHGTIVERNSATIAMIQHVIQFTDTQMDNLFIQSKNIEL